MTNQPNTVGEASEVERVARALYEHWVSENIGSDEWASWEKLGDKESWLDRASAAIAAMDTASMREALELLEEMLDTFDGQPMPRDAQADREDAIIARVANFLNARTALNSHGDKNG